jgi:hypothetical protein
VPESSIAMYRAVRKDDYPEGVIVDDHAVHGVLYPDFERKPITSGKNKGKFREPDVVYADTRHSEVNPGGGTSLFNKPDVFGARYWHSFAIPKGTTIPGSLQIVFTHHNTDYDADHYQIEPASLRMPVASYKAALDNLARNAVEMLYRNARR